MRKKDLYWLAGLIEGEGCFTTVSKKYKYKTITYAKFVIAMCDEDIIIRAANLLNTGYYTEPKPNKDHNTQYRIQLVGKKAIPIFNLFRPHMGQRRKDRIDEILNNL